MATSINIQVANQGFGSYLQGILPDDVAIAAGAFSATMQQIRNIASTPVEKFAQVVGHIETDKDLTQINGSIVPVNSSLANAASALIAKGSGPYGTYTMSDFFGCMTGLPYDWSGIQTQIAGLQSDNLLSIYSSLYAAVTTPAGPAWPAMNTTIQTLINSANAEIAAIKAAQPSKASALNKLWDNTGTQLTIEQRARNVGLAPLPSPRDKNISRFPSAQYGFVDSIPRMALDTEPNMAAQTLEAISDICTPGGQSIVGMMREARNQARLAIAGIPLDNNIPDTLPPTVTKSLIANGSLPDTAPATLEQTRCSDGSLITPEPAGVYNPVDDSYYVNSPTLGGIVNSPIIGSVPAGSFVPDVNYSIDYVGDTDFTAIGATDNAPGTVFAATGEGAGTGIASVVRNVSVPSGQSVDTGQAAEPGSLAGSPYTRLIPANLNVIYTSDILLPATLTPAEAINAVIECNCDCWVSP